MRISTLLLTGAVLSLTTSFAARAQTTGTHFGIKAGVSSTVLDGQFNRKAFYQTGFSGGLMLRLRPSRGFAVQPELLFVQQGVGNGLRPGSSSPDYNIKLNYVNVPVMMKIYIGGVFNFQLGPQVGFMLSAHEKGSLGGNNGTGISVDRDVKADYYPVDFAVNTGLGVDLPMGLVASARLVYGLSDINDNKAETELRELLKLGGIHNRGFEFSLGYLIGANKK